MPKLTKPTTENFTEAELEEMAGGAALEDCKATLEDNGDGTHTFTVTPPRKGKTTPAEKAEQEQLEGYIQEGK